MRDENEFISSFEGTYIDLIEDELYLVVNTVKDSKVDELLALPQINSYKDFLHFEKANNSISQIYLNFGEIIHITQSMRPQGVIVYIDMSINNNVLYILHSEIDNTEFINAVEPFNPSIIYEDPPPAPQNIIQSQLNDDFNSVELRILGGDGLYNNETESICSVGFWTRDKYNQNELYIITAGHCMDEENVQKYNFFFMNHGILRYPNAHILDQLIISDGVPVYSHGVHMCKSGSTSHFTCGHVLGLNGIYSSREGIAYELIITDMSAETGDSGGSVISFVSPQDLNLVAAHGIHILRGACAQPIDTIFRVIKENTERELTLYQRGS
ncbi:hypothetical protein C2G38_2293809 [Gigaspora rosea]|uniref:Trypsin-like cysteine/serine peptidase domain-containing protein n=1 Tax=Gigaspora rosea TaxID=44941 RepID=A0A397VJX4_9GLOM|nr:hypothetical protein C2G38_2293809 [Gigaspora rosea]